MQLEVDRYCFVCGPDNPSGLKLTLQAGEGTASASFVPLPEHQGYAGVSHGGILAALLDEAMVYAAVSLGHWAATAEMTIRYHRPVPTSEELRVSAEVTRRQKRLVECRAEIRGASGDLLASGTAKLMQGKVVTEDEKFALRQRQSAIVVGD